MSSFVHETVLKTELVESLGIEAGSIVIDCTAGGGGHTEGLLEAVGESGLVVALDRDDMAIETLKGRFARDLERGKLKIVKTKFSQIVEVAKDLGIAGKIAGIAADIGVSSPQLDLAERGFSFGKEGPLDMRMDQSPGVSSARDLVNEASEQELTRIFREFGEEPKARFIARAIVTERAKEPIETTTRLAEIAKGAVFYKEKSKKHPATKIFQALRIAVNQELEELDLLVSGAFALLAPKGRLGIITFHSLEDRYVKHKFKDLTGQDKRHAIPRNLPLTAAEVEALAKVDARLIKPFPIVPSEAETQRNPRSRSAKLRVIQKL